MTVVITHANPTCPRPSPASSPASRITHRGSSVPPGLRVGFQVGRPGFAPPITAGDPASQLSLAFGFLSRRWERPQRPPLGLSRLQESVYGRHLNSVCRRELSDSGSVTLRPCCCAGELPTPQHVEERAHRFQILRPEGRTFGLWVGGGSSLACISSGLLGTPGSCDL